LAAAEEERSSIPTKSYVELFTPREREAVGFLLQGCSNQEIAEQLAVSINTVKFHMKNIFGKLGVKSRSEAVGEVVRNRLI